MHGLMVSVFPSFLRQKKPGSHCLKSAERYHLGHWLCHSKSNWFTAIKPAQCVAMLSPLHPFLFMLLSLKTHSLTACVFKGFIALRFCLLMLFEQKLLFYRVIIAVTRVKEFMRKNAYRLRFATFIHFTAATALSVCVYCNFTSSPPHPSFRSPLAEHLLSLLTLPNCLDRLEVGVVFVSWLSVPSVVSWS